MATRKNITRPLTLPERQAADIRVRAVEAGEFRLVDGAGRMRALLEMTRAGPRLAMMHEDGTVAIEVMLARDGPGVRLTDRAGKTRLFAGAMRGTPRIGIADAEGSQRLFVGLSHGGEPSVTLYDTSQRQVWTTQGARGGKGRRTPARPGAHERAARR